jgi:hypothetical protein
MGNRKSAYEEVMSLFDQLIKVLPKFVDGKKAILEMKDGGGRNWRQMEWIGFWFEFFLEKNLIPILGGTRGPTFGTTQFDFKKKFVWDLKAHPSGTNNLILNDQNAIKNCVESEKGLGFIIISGIVKYDNGMSEFKKWHDDLKGGTSTYEKERVARGAPSRRRKISFEPENLIALWFDDIGEINSAVKDGWLKSFQTDMKNSNGMPRPAKFQFNLGGVSKNNMIAELKIN